MSLPQYPEHKETGIAWLGPVPTHWSVAAVGYRYEVLLGKMLDERRITGEHLAPYLRNVDVQWDRINIENLPEMDFSGNDIVRYALTPGDLLVCEGGEVGRAAIWHGDVDECYYQKALHRLRCWGRAKDVPRFMLYLLRAASSLNVFTSSEGKSTIAHLTAETLRRYRFAFPSFREQKQIVDFLDDETSKIDALISEQEKLLELLAEKRQATISHAVTRGLNPDTPMKDSGVEWLGVIPKHWNVIRLAQLFHEISEPGEDALPILSVSIHDGVSDGELDEDEMERKVTRSDDRSKYKRVAPGDLVYNMMRAWQGGFGSVEVPGMVSPAYVVARPIGSNIVTGYIEQLLRTAAGAKEAKRYSKGVTDFRLRLYWDEFKNICVPLPPKGEQVAIMHALDDSNARIEGLATEARTVISLLRERRAALISAAVTGKIDVRKHPSALAAAA